MQLLDILLPERIRLPMQATTKLDAITELIDVLDATHALVDRTVALEAVLKRENERTTGIGYGLAIPHGKSTGCKSLAMAAGKPAQPINFGSLDGRPVTFVVLLCSPPDQTSQHINALAKISRLMNTEAFRSKVQRAVTPQELYNAIREHDVPA